jgi:hypothetical protein
MKSILFAAIVAFSAQLAVAQAPTATLLSPRTTLPISFDHSIDSKHVHVGDVISARTTQPVHLSNGQAIPAGSRISGHVTASDAFVFDPTPYAKQRQGQLAIHFDSIDAQGKSLPLNIYVRALADPLTAWAARRPKPSDEDSLGTLTQIGGDQVTPSQNGVMSQDGDIVGYQKRGGIYAHLISASGNSPDSCDASDTEESMGLFSASACGLYGFADSALIGTGKTGEHSTLTIASRRRSPKIWAHSTALLEVLPGAAGLVSE